MGNFVIPEPDTPKGDGLSEYISKSIAAFSDISGIPVTYFNKDGEMVREFLPEAKICGFFGAYSDCNSLCRKNLASSGHFAARLGEPYIHLCKAGLSNITMSHIVNGEFLGYFVAGPLVMRKLRESTLSNFRELNKLDSASFNLAKTFAGSMKVFEPDQLSEIALMLYNSIITATSRNSDYEMLHNQYNRSNKINEDIRKYKKQNASFDYPYEMEQTLIQNVMNGNTEAALENVRSLLYTFSILEAGNLEAIKAKTLWLFAIVLRLATNRNESLGEISDTDLDVISKISEAKDFETLTNTATSLISLISGNMISSVYDGHSQIVSKALQFVNANYMHRISLDMTGKELHVNSSYFSTLFKSEMGVSFTQYVNRLRVSKAEELLANSNMRIIDILMAVGFDDQSYFTKVFRKETGYTPRQFRAKSGGEDTEE